LQSADLKARMILQVHDELLLECPENELNDTIRVVRSEMENAFTLSIPLTSEARSGKNWGSMQVINI
jgi:DNA polymerase-1